MPTCLQLMLAPQHRREVENALSPKKKLHGFRSGGGLRVLTLGNQFYAESHSFPEAFRILAEDIRAGGRPYKEVYGPIETPFYTGSVVASDPVDEKLLRGFSVDVYRAGSDFVCEMNGFADTQIPLEVYWRAQKTGETQVHTDERGEYFFVTPGFSEDGAYTGSEVRARNPGVYVSCWPALYRGTGATVQEALMAACWSSPIAKKPNQ